MFNSKSVLLSLLLFFLSLISNAQTNFNHGLLSAGCGGAFPPGMVIAFATTECPTGWLKADGSSVSRADKACLFEAIGTTHGNGVDSSTFRLPDYRGRFLRGVAEGSAVDPDKNARGAMASGGVTGNNVGSVQGHAFQTHTHTQNAHQHLQTHRTLPYTGIQGGSNGEGGYWRDDFGSIDAGRDNVVGQGGDVAGSRVPYTQPVQATNQNAAATGANSQGTVNETRPVNAYVLYCVKE